jgi:GTPase Era involved in 16S rRNA processing
VSIVLKGSPLMEPDAVKDMSDKLLLAEVFLEHSCEEMLPEVPADVAVLIIKVL